MTTLIKLNQEWKRGSKLATGGFGSVYEAESDTGEQVVLKLIPKTPGAERELLFENLQNVPNVIPILDSGEWKDNWILVMCRAERSLREHLDAASGPLPLDEAVAILTDVAEALAGLEAEVVHRDLKPNNLLLHEGHWCLADFGIARYAEASTAPDTHKYAMTPPYAAPEQWRGDRATHASDVYAFGVIGYEMIAGERPFPGPDFRKQHLDEEAQPLASCPAWLASLITECLFKPQEARPTPGNLLARLKGGQHPASEAAQRLQRAGKAAAEKRAVEEAVAAAAQSEAERRQQLFKVAEPSLERIRSLLRERVTQAAPQTKFSRALLLNDAQLSIAPVTPVLGGALEYPGHDPCFDVIAKSSITLEIPRDRWQYEGRSHSLWYCDAKDEGVYRWYETAFMVSGAIPKRGIKDPFALDPGKDAAGALVPVMDVMQVAWPFTPTDQGEEEDFTERWMGWFADAANGELHHPQRMPERETKGSWRCG